MIPFESLPVGIWKREVQGASALQMTVPGFGHHGRLQMSSWIGGGQSPGRQLKGRGSPENQEQRGCRGMLGSLGGIAEWDKPKISGA